MPRHSVFVILFYFELVRSVTRNTPPWTYDDESTWPGDKCSGVGLRQSPIDIISSDVIKDFRRQYIKYGELSLTGYQEVLLSAINNGLTIMFKTEGEEAIHPTVRGGPLKLEYRLEQIHFHCLSEHAIDGNKYPVEIHLVHVRSDLTGRKALKYKDGLAIIAIFCQIMEQEDLTETALDELTALLPKLEKIGNQVSGALLNLTKLLSPNRSLYYTYAGSLTSPMCNEVVTWIIFPEPIHITEAQYNLIEKVREGRYNFRSLQPLNRHIVYQPPADFFITPQIVTSFKNAVLTITGFFKNATSLIMKGFKTP